MHSSLDAALHEEIQKFIGETAVVEHGLILFSFLNKEGESRTGYISFNNPDIQQTLGMMELAKAHIVLKQGDLTGEDDDS